MTRYQVRTRACVFSLGLLGMASLTTPAFAESLTDALAMAYQNNPSLEAQRAALRATDEGVPQAKSGFLPTLRGTGSISKSKQNSFFAGNNATLTPKQLQVTLSQPVFNGFQTLNNLKQANREVMAGRADLQSTEADTLLQAVTAYVNVVRDQAVLKLNENQVEVLSRELDASKNRFEVGDITRTDVAQSEARLSAAQSARIAAEAQLTASRQSYMRVIGQMPGTLEDNPPIPMLPQTQDAAMETAGESNPTLVGALYREQAANYSVDSAAGALLPSVDLQASYSRNVDTFLPGSDTNSKQITAQITIPFYSGGQNYSRVRQAKQLKSQRQMQIIAARRTVEEQVSNAWIGLKSAESTIVSNQAQVDANEIALEGVRQEAEVGSRTTLDVLNAEQELLNARADLIRAKSSRTVAAYTLLSAIGKLTAQNLQLPVNYYDPQEHYKDVDNKFFGWGTGKSD